MTGMADAERAAGGTSRPAPPVLSGGLPWLGLLPDLRRDSLAVFGRARALGGVVRVPVPRHRLYLVSAPAQVRQVLQDNAANYRRTPFHDAPSLPDRNR